MANRSTSSAGFSFDASTARRWVSALGLGVSLIGAAACPGCPENNMAPSDDLSVQFRVEPSGGRTIAAGSSVAYRVVVERKGILNAGVEFEVRNLPEGLSATVTPARISETAQETQLLVTTDAAMRPGSHQLDLKGRLTVGGQGAPEWYSPVFLPNLTITGGQPAFDLECADDRIGVRAGSQQELTCLTRRDATLTSDITFTFGAKPAFLTIAPDPGVVGPASDRITFTIGRLSAPQTPASVDLLITATAGGVSRQHPLTIDLPSENPVVGVDIMCTGELAIPAGASRILTCRILRASNLTRPVEFSFGPHPSYIMIYDETATAGPTQESIEFTIVRALDAQTPAFIDLEVIAEAFPFNDRAIVRIHLPNS
jgi:hypothetical protein